MAYTVTHLHTGHEMELVSEIVRAGVGQAGHLSALMTSRSTQLYGGLSIFTVGLWYIMRLTCVIRRHAVATSAVATRINFVIHIIKIWIYILNMTI